ncbi:MAG: hypothetical protein M3Q30_15045 [Actinomycetota bacterium]|nr:hypothetical protein [Actinomycetota bacterium]
MDEGTGADAGTGDEVDLGDADAAEMSMLPADDVEAEDPEGEPAVRGDSLAEGGVHVEHLSRADRDDGDDVGEPELIDTRTRANRRNATSSTGPKTVEGKQRSSLNALRHGAYAQKSVAIPSGVLAEDQAAIDEYVDAIVESLDPRTALECRVAERFANLMLSAERLPRYAAALIGEPPDPLALSSGADHEYADASRQALRYIDQVTKIDARVGTALQQTLRQYEQLREMDLAI